MPHFPVLPLATDIFEVFDIKGGYFSFVLICFCMIQLFAPFHLSHLLVHFIYLCVCLFASLVCNLSLGLPVFPSEKKQVKHRRCWVQRGPCPWASPPSSFPPIDSSPSTHIWVTLYVLRVGQLPSCGGRAKQSSRKREETATLFSRQCASP